MLNVNADPFSPPSLNTTTGLVRPCARAWLVSSQVEREELYLDQVLDNPKLFISSLSSAGSRELLERHGIKAMLSLVPQPFEDVTLATHGRGEFDRYRVVTSSCPGFHGLGISRYLISLPDHEKTSPDKLLEAFNLMRWICKEHSEEPILVHCQAGMSRSVSLVAAFIAKYQGWSFEEGAREVGYHRAFDIHERFAENLSHAVGIPFDKRR